MKFTQNLFQRRKGKKRGIAIIATLFTIAIVLILGTSFTILTFKESRSARSDKNAAIAKQLAKAGAELMLNHMSVVGNWASEVSEEGTTRIASSVLKDYPSSAPHILKQGDMLDETFNFSITRNWDAVKSAYLYDVMITPDRPMDSQGEYVGRIRIEITQAVFKNGQPPQFIVTSMGSIIKAATNEVAANRVVEVRFREKTALDNLLFIQNMRAWDLVGNGVSPPNGSDGSNDAVGIADNFTANGPVTVDGNSDYATETAGNMNFFGTDNVHIYGQTNINQDENLFPTGTTEETIDGVFMGGINTGQESFGLPQKEGYMSADVDGNGSISASEKGRAVQLAEDKTGTNAEGQGFVRAHYRCGDNTGLSASSGTIGHSVASDPEQWMGEYGLPDTPANRSLMANELPSDIEFDGEMLNSKPGFANYTVEFYADGTVSVMKTTAYTQVSTTLHNRVKINRFKHGMLYFEGGNVEVKNAENNGGVNGQLTIVNSEDPYREAVKYEVHTSDGHVITQYATEEKNQSAYPSNPDRWVPGKVGLTGNTEITGVKQIFTNNSIYVSYDDGRIPVRIDPVTGELSEEFDRVPPYFVGGKWVWPGESSVNNTISNVATTDGNMIGIYNDIEREGNITLGANLTYTNAGNNALGLISKNYILINDDNISANSPELSVNAVLMSFDHSLQFDDVNMSRKDSWISQPDMNGTFNFTGSNIGAFADVESKVDGTGYTTQTLMYDQNLKNTLPPNFPTWDSSQMNPNVVLEYIILSYQDKGAIKTY
ncbi:MAG: hypothetical protein K8T10_00835 [Candidatus Eremiobacteraeota bacterium]|nr:hypothetical protein [Candidatus Eremiobacteraeota bacterium]